MKRLVLALLLLAACREEEAVVPDPISLTDRAVSHYCMMNLSEHGGPKAQIHLTGYPAPLFFAQVRDALAYLKGPERDAEIAVVYVSDMARAASWDRPGADNWIQAHAAHFVVGADVTGGMGAPEIVPFGDETRARDFAAEKGGRVLTLDGIAPELVLAPVDMSGATETGS